MALSFTTSVPPVPRETAASIASQSIATPTHGQGGTFTVHVSKHIAASPDTVFTVLADHSKWPEWNRFVPRVTASRSPPRTDAHASPDANPLYKAIQADDGSTFIKKDANLTFHVHMDPENATSWSTKQTMHVTLLEPFDETKARPGWRIAWKATSFPSVVLRTERVQEVVDDGNGATEYTCWETMYGPMAAVIRLAMGSTLEKCFQCWTDDLTKRSEDEEAAKSGCPRPST